MADYNKQIEQRLNALDDKTREKARKYTDQFMNRDQIPMEEALEKGISKTEMEDRNL
jgi:hypothetical protein